LKKRLLVYFFFISFLILLSLELFLRFYYGFCDAVLMQESTAYEYIAQPNQSRFRFRNHVDYNSYSMRSDEVDTTSAVIAGLGDSVLNGGVLTDQDSLATSILSDRLGVQFLNISAGSWGPDNCYAYLKKHGHFQAKHLFLAVSSHDAYDNMDFSSVVGYDASLPDKQYPLAIYELLDRYLLPRLGIQTKKESLGINKKKANSRFNSGFSDLLAYANAHAIPLTIVLHAEASEVEKGCYNEQGLEILAFAKKNNIPVIEDLPSMQASYYRDNIHPNERGQKQLASLILAYLQNSE
jgi:hypothetical protein